MFVVADSVNGDVTSLLGEGEVMPTVNGIVVVVVVVVVGV